MLKLDLSQKDSPSLATVYKNGSIENMKKIIILIFILNLFSIHSHALTDVEVSGEIDFSASAWNLPTGERGNSAYTVPTMFLNIEAPLQNDNLFFLRMDGSEEKTTATDRFALAVREAYLDVVSPFQTGKSLRLGLMPDPWIEAVYEAWPYRFLGETGWAITEKWKYMNFSDAGFTYRSAIPDTQGEWAITLVNGEGASEKEEGPRKDGSVFVRFVPIQKWVVALNYLYGAYEKYDADFNKKERYQALVSYDSGTSWQFGLEYFKAQDPADAVRVNKMAEEVSVVDLTGQSIVAQGASFYTIVDTGPLAETFLRFDYLQPVEGLPGREIKTAMTGVGYRFAEDIKLALSVDYTEYGKDFAPAERDRSKLQAAAQVLF